MKTETIRENLAALVSRLDGRASGAWRIEGDRLVLVALEPAPDLPTEVARGFEAATRTVELTLSNFGIVGAATTGRATISIAAELPAEAGSGRWLRAFGAARSVAVPLLDDRGRVGGVVSLALGLEPGAEVVEAAIRGLDWS